MGKIIYLPGVDPHPPSRNELVDRASDLILREVCSVFINYRVEPGPLGPWYQAIRDYFWAREIGLHGGDFLYWEVDEWRSHWRIRVLEFIGRGRS